MRTSAYRTLVFLEKDGTLVDDVPYNVDPSRVRLAVGAAEGLKRLAAYGYGLVVVTNQPGVARGFFEEAALTNVRARIEALLAPLGVALDGFYHCPHDPAGSVAPYDRRCFCRKPAPGMLQRAASELGANLADCWLVGDILDDVEAGRRAACRTVLIDNGNETEWRAGPWRLPHHTAADLYEAAHVIVDRDGPSRRRRERARVIERERRRMPHASKPEAG